MSENILVVEYEPKYTDRVRAALAGQPFTASFARDGEEAMQAIAAQPLKLVVLSSIIPKVSTADLIRAIRGRDDMQKTPILLTVSGYTGKTPKQDAVRLGASDILPKPFSESEFLGKVQQLLGTSEPGTLTSSEIFGDLVDDAAGAAGGGGRKPMAQNDDIDKMLADKLGAAMPKRRESTMPGTAPKPATLAGTTPIPRPRTAAGTAEIDKMLQDTLSGLEKRKTATNVPLPKTTAPADMPIPPRMLTPLPDRIPISYPIIEAPVAAQPKEEEEPTDGIRFGQYVLLDKIATGGMAEVWKARKRGEEGFQKIVAIKKILPHLSDNQEFIEMFIDEAKLAAQLNHNNIIHIYDLGKIGSSYYIAMELVDGFDLKTILKWAADRDQPLVVELALFITSKVAAALDYAHRKRDFDDKEMGLVHRDVSPQNVLISQEGDIKLCDFGIAKAASKASHTHAGALKGKLQYMSPEQAWGRNIDRRSDIFALAAVLFELLTARKLFTGDNEMSILEQVREARITPPSTFNEEVTPEIDAVVLKALAKEPADRYQTAAEMARELDSILYNFKPTPTSADLAIYMHRLSTSLPVPAPMAEPEPEPEPVVEAPAPQFAAPAPPPPAAFPVAAVAATAAAAAAAVPMPAWDAPAAPIDAPRKRSAAAPIAVVLLLVAAVGGAFFYLRTRETSAAPPTSAVQTASTAPVAAPVDSAPAVMPDTTGTLIPVPTAIVPGAPQQPSLDAAAVAQEVQKRLAAERLRLEEQTRAQQQVQTSAPVPAPAVSRPATQTPAPIPVPTQTAAPAPAPVETATVAPPPVEAVPEPQPASVPQPAVAQRVREGDLVPPGTEGLIPARVVRRGNVAYPPMARAQRVEGTVILNVLVSETGQVLDVRILRGVNRGGGLNEAAVQSARRTSFSPPTKDGVRVKAWTTVPVDFKL
jgi:TonB family protein